MTIFKQVTPNLRKVITFVRTTENGCVAKTYNSLLDMPENERKAYIMAAFSQIEKAPTPEEVSVARELLQNAINGCVAKTYNSLLDMPENKRKAYIMAAFSRIENTPTPEEVSVAREHLQNAINARLAQRGKNIF